VYRRRGPVRGLVLDPVRVPSVAVWLRAGRQLSLLVLASKEQSVDVRARLTSKGQVTIPASVREALELREGDEVVFRVERSRALMAKIPDFLSLAGSVPVPAGKRGTPWDEVLRRTRSQRAERRR
jgi:antitoxin PrlF